MKKLVSLILAIMMIAAVGAAFAAVNSDGTLNDDNGITSTETTINIAKQIVFVNSETTTVREPNITYTYTISAVTPTSATITDKNGMTGTVKAGILTAVTGATTATTSTVTFADTATSSATSDGTSTASKYAAFTFDATKFLVSGALTPGIYRYKITETTNVTKASVGIKEAATYENERWLDVYVKWTDDNHTALEVYGYVLYEGTDSQAITSDDITGGDVSMKSTGYVNTATTTGEQADVDVYTTENLYIEKTTTGTMADKGNDFPIALTLAAATGVTANPKIDVVLGGNGTLTGTASDTVGTYITFATSMSGTVDNGSSIYLKGIPAGSTVSGASASLVETNNTPDSYKVKAGTTSGGSDLLTEAIVAAATNSGATQTQTLTEKKSIFLTNTLDAISPTGYVSRFAPYALILIGGIALLIVAKKRKPAKDDEE